MNIINIGVFAYNEQENIANIINDLDLQSVMTNGLFQLSVQVLCNGCTDKTVPIAITSVERCKNINKFTEVKDYKVGSKSITWNKFINSNIEGSDFIICIDGDIRIHDQDAIINLIHDLDNSNSYALTSRPMKKLDKLNRKPLLKVATKIAGAEHVDGKICGQFYAVKTDNINNIQLPNPCLVEDGFLAACLITSLFTHEGDPKLIKASQSVCHEFEVPGSLKEFFYHDVRILLGCELNAAYYSFLWEATDVKERIEILNSFSKSDKINDCIEEHLKHPERSALKKQKYFDFLFRIRSENMLIKIAKLPIRFLYVVYINAVKGRAKRLFIERTFFW